MHVRWRGLELPAGVDVDPKTRTDSFGRFTVEPLERGFGTTIGNSLRRILLSSCLLYTSPSPRDRTRSRMPSSA